MCLSMHIVAVDYTCVSKYACVFVCVCVFVCACACVCLCLCLILTYSHIFIKFIQLYNFLTLLCNCNSGFLSNILITAYTRCVHLVKENLSPACVYY